MILKSDAIKAFLNAKAQPDLAALYNAGMEVQINVAMDKGKRIEVGGVNAKGGFAYTDGIETWRAFRIPRKAMSDPEDNDGPMGFNLEEHVEGIGLTGWDWKERKSRWVAYDFDAMLGHSEKHQKKLSEKELNEIQEVITKLPFLTLRRSTSGRGLHLYVHLDPIDTANHTEHAALARSILSYIAGITGYNFADKVDICGSNMWVWHRKGIGTNGLSLIRQGDVFPISKVPPNWRDHLAVIGRKSTRIASKFEGVSDKAFSELSGQRSKVVLDEEHTKLVTWLTDHAAPGWWDADNHCLITHTHFLREAKEDKSLSIRGEFETVSSGKDAGYDINCFMFPMKNGSWAVRRYGQGTQEAKLWIQDGKGWTRTYFNRELSLADVARLYEAAELESGGYQFKSFKRAKEALLKIGIDIEIDESVYGRPTTVRESRQDYKVVVSVPSIKNEKLETPGWSEERGSHRKLFNNPSYTNSDDSVALGDFDDMVRHIVSENGEDLGWVIKTDSGDWRYEPVQNVRLFMTSHGINRKDTDMILGKAVNSAWRVVNKPFQPEYPGDREWNRSSARFKVAPTLDGESLSYPTWQAVLDHCGASLNDAIAEDSWCSQAGVRNGGDYLKLWLACLFKFPQHPLPFLAFWGPQNSGKSTFHESICEHILDGGFMDGLTALESQGKFNGELQDSILCTLEEANLRDKNVYNRIKDWITSSKISIHVKGQTPYKALNYTHWIQCVNDRDYIPVFSGDTRVTISYVDSLPDERRIPKRELWNLLKKEASDFLAALLGMEIPDSKDRLMLPVITTADKQAAEFSSMNPVEQFFKDAVFHIPGALIRYEDAYEAFKVWCQDPEVVAEIGSKKFSRLIPQHIPGGRVSGIKLDSVKYDQSKFLGNVSLNPDVIPDGRWYSNGMFMKKEKRGNTC